MIARDYKQIYVTVWYPHNFGKTKKRILAEKNNEREEEKGSEKMKEKVKEKQKKEEEKEGKKEKGLSKKKGKIKVD